MTADSGAPAPEPPRPGESARPSAVRWLSAALWAILVMVLLGLLALWLYGGGHRGGAREALPVLSRVPDFALVSHRGEAIDREALAARPWVADLVFTRCALSCPRMTARMVALGEHLDPRVRRVSISVDPEYDTPDVLTRYAAAYGAEGEEWLFLTGDPAQVRRLAAEGLLLGIAETPPDDPNWEQEPITHSTRFVLVDGDGQVRGYYDAFDREAFERLARDANRLAAGP